MRAGGSAPVPWQGTPRYSRRVLAQGSAFVLQHLLRAVDVVEPVRVHRHQDAADVGLRDSDGWDHQLSQGDDPPPKTTCLGSLGDTVCPEAYIDELALESRPDVAQHRGLLQVPGTEQRLR